MRICVTGGAGFIGSHLVDRLIDMGHTVLVIDNLITGLEAYVNKQAEFKKMDVRDSKIKDVFQIFKPDYVFHEAAQTMVPASIEDPQYDCDVNLMGLINILDACRYSGVKKILMPSSAAVYGDNGNLPLKETEIGQPSSFYGLTKLTTESYLRLYEEHFGLPYICYRYSNVYGPRQGHGGEGGVVSIFAEQGIANKGITIFGDGEQTRDFIYVEDVVEANICGLEHPDITGIFNVSTNTETSINDLIQIFNTIREKPFEITYEAERLGDIKHSRLCNIKANEILGFSAKVPLVEGLALTYEYFKTHQ